MIIAIALVRRAPTAAMVPEVGLASAASRLLFEEAGMGKSGRTWQPPVFATKRMPYLFALLCSSGSQAGTSSARFNWLGLGFEIGLGFGLGLGFVYFAARLIEQ